MSYLDNNYEPLMLRFKLPTINQLFHYHDHTLALSYKLYYGLKLYPDITSIFIVTPPDYNLMRPRIYQEYTTSKREN